MKSTLSISKLLSKGYFPKELPPPFTTENIGKKNYYILKKWEEYLTNLQAPNPNESNNQAKKRFEQEKNRFEVSRLIEYNIAKGNYSRRKIEISHPIPFLYLSKEIINNWKEINSIYKLSTYSESQPITDKNIKRSVRTKSRSWRRFKNKLTDISYNYKVQLKLDITNFYPSIYTHSIPWSLLGKDDSKIYFKIKSENRSNFNTILSSDPKAILYNKADKLDTLVRNCNDKQSIGFPIGPDTSLILAELISSRIDYEIKNEIGVFDYKCIRYYDDYYIYTNSIGDAENILKRIQKIFYRYKLELNENKVEIKQLPYSQNDIWIVEIHNYKFSKVLIVDRLDLEYYFSLIFKIIETNPKNSSWIISYSLSRFEYGKNKVSENIFSTFLSLLLKTLYLETSVIDQIFNIIYTY